VQAAADIARRVLDGERGALARMISWAENGDARFADALAEVFPRIGQAWRVGVTGPPGAGKSTLTNELAEHLSAAEQTVGVQAIDPTSPFSGGALLGDRIRMEARTSDPRVFIRSMASRGSHGGLARAAVDACDAMDACGLQNVLVETVGVGQAEYDVMGATDTVLVVLCPGAGDGIQAMKAGLLEVADVLVVNKSDQPGADRLAADLSEAVHVRGIHREERADEWEVPIVRTTAATGEGVEDVLAAMAAHRAHLEAGDLARLRAARRVDQVRRVVGERLDEELWGTAAAPGLMRERAESRLGQSATPYHVAEEILASVLRASRHSETAVSEPER
jgi:LAO/AO transport system kinase